MKHLTLYGGWLCSTARLFVEMKTRSFAVIFPCFRTFFVFVRLAFWLSFTIQVSNMCGLMRE